MRNQPRNAASSYDWSTHAPQQWRSQVAPDVLPILLSLAMSGETITYSGLAEQLQSQFGHEPKARKTLYGQPVGAVGFAIRDLAKSWRKSIPPINALVVAKDTGLPGKGADWFVRQHLGTRNRVFRRAAGD